MVGKNLLNNFNYLGEEKWQRKNPSIIKVDMLTRDKELV
jgi:hypothetical protein